MMPILFAAGCNAWTIEYQFGEDPEPPTPPTSSQPTESSSTLSLPGEQAVAVQSCDTCNPTHPAWDVVAEWIALPAAPFATSSMASVADLNGDGLSEVVLGVANVQGGWLAALHGDGTPFPFATPPPPIHAGTSGLSIADIDGDGLPEIVGVTGDQYESAVFALEVDGTILWISETFSLTAGAVIYAGTCAPMVADLEGDGQVEVVCDTLVLDGATGATRSHAPWIPDQMWTTQVIVDLDLDGIAEIVTGRRARDPDGALKWELPGIQGLAAYPTAVQLDADPEAELLIAGDGRLFAVDTDGTELWRADVTPGSTTAGSPPCIADLDGDGELEVAAAFRTVLAAFELDGTPIWTVPIRDQTTAAGCSALDLDLDGRAEIAFADEHAFRLLCGVDGSELYIDATHTSGTQTEYPVPADVDGDGQAELVVTRNGDQGAGVVVYGARTGWPAVGRTWPQFDGVTTVDTAGGVGGPVSLPEGGLVHARPVAGPITPPGPLPNLRAIAVDQTLDQDGGRAVAVQVENVGPLDAPAGGVLVVSQLPGLFDTDTVRILRTVALPVLPSGVRLAATRFDLTAEEAGTTGLRLTVEVDVPVCNPLEAFLVAWDE